MARPKPPAAALLSSPDDTEQQFYEALQRGDIESRVLARAVRWHVEHRVLLNGHKSVIFR